MWSTTRPSRRRTSPLRRGQSAATTNPLRGHPSEAGSRPGPPDHRRLRRAVRDDAASRILSNSGCRPPRREFRPLLTRRTGASAPSASRARPSRHRCPPHPRRGSGCHSLGTERRREDPPPHPAVHFEALVATEPDHRDRGLQPGPAVETASATSRSPPGRVRPPFFMSRSPHLRDTSSSGRRDGISVSTGDMDLVGVALARAGYASVQEREYPVILLIGGSRIPFDLTGLLGAESTDHKLEHLRDVMPTRPPVDVGLTSRSIQPSSAARGAFDVVRRAFRLDGLTLEQFEASAPSGTSATSSSPGGGRLRGDCQDGRPCAQGVLRAAVTGLRGSRNPRGLALSRRHYAYLSLGRDVHHAGRWRQARDRACRAPSSASRSPSSRGAACLPDDVRRTRDSSRSRFRPRRQRHRSVGTRSRLQIGLVHFVRGSIEGWT